LNLSPDWPADESIVYFASNRFNENGEDIGENSTGRTNIWQATWRRNPESVGDFNLDEQKDETDIELLGDAMSQTYELRFRQYDLNESGEVDAGDLTQLIESELNTWLGDANLDGLFDSADFVAVFTAAEYEDDISDNSTWSTGDWNQDGEFDSGDFVAAFISGGYEKGPRRNPNAVPEPASTIIGLAGLMAIAVGRRRQDR
jgi:hypothetical protein